MKEAQLQIEIRSDLSLPDHDLTRAILALNCLLSSPEPYGEDTAPKWQLLYELGMVESGRLIVPPGVLLAEITHSWEEEINRVGSF